MKVFGIVLTFLGALGLVILVELLKTLAVTEAQTRIERLPAALLRLASRRLPIHHRQSVYEEEWLPELAYIVRVTDGMPLTRLIRGVKYSVGLVFAARSVARGLGNTRRPKPAAELVEPDEDLRTSRNEFRQADVLAVAELSA